MKRIIYGGGELITSIDVADALLDYSRYLIRMGTSVAVKLPVLELSR